MSQVVSLGSLSAHGMRRSVEQGGVVQRGVLRPQAARRQQRRQLTLHLHAPSPGLTVAGVRRHTPAAHRGFHGLPAPALSGKVLAMCLPNVSAKRNSVNCIVHLHSAPSYWLTMICQLSTLDSNTFNKNNSGGAKFDRDTPRLTNSHQDMWHLHTAAASSEAARMSRKGRTTARTGAGSGRSTASTDPGITLNSDDAPRPCVCSAPAPQATGSVAGHAWQRIRAPSVQYSLH